MEVSCANHLRIIRWRRVYFSLVARWFGSEMTVNPYLSGACATSLETINVYNSFHDEDRHKQHGRCSNDPPYGLPPGGIDVVLILDSRRLD